MGYRIQKVRMGVRIRIGGLVVLPNITKIFSVAHPVVSEMSTKVTCGFEDCEFGFSD